ncbi:MAG: ankyrin repeat domain-containing protein [Holosporaceae bacterium]|jgi:ankyrin repeat protein|nr:ankyrin repeat domain-containing protein [Holosporaceae bacterium]
MKKNRYIDVFSVLLSAVFLLLTVEQSSSMKRAESEQWLEDQLVYAVESGDMDEIRFLIKKNRNRDGFVEKITRSSSAPITEDISRSRFKDLLKGILHLAVKFRKLVVIRSLLMEGLADVNATDSHGNTPLHLAVKLKDLKAIEILLEDKNIDIKKVNDKNRTALYYAFESEHEDMIELLVNKDAEVINVGSTPWFETHDISIKYVNQNMVDFIKKLQKRNENNVPAKKVTRSSSVPSDPIDIAVPPDNNDLAM